MQEVCYLYSKRGLNFFEQLFFSHPIPTSMKSSLAPVMAAVFTAAGALFGQVYTPPVGYVSLTVPANSDAALGAPLERASEFQGIVQSINGNVITLAGQPGWATNRFVYEAGVQSKTYYLRIDSDSKEGLTLPIASNDSSSVTVTIPAGEDLSGILTNAVDGSGNGSTVSISPYWTISSLFSGAIPGTQILVSPTTTPGINLPLVTYTFNGTNWVRGSSFANDDVIGTNQGLLIRNNSTTTAVNLTITGAVPMSQHRMRLSTLAANTRQDIRFFYNSPVPEVIGSVFNVGSLNPGDQLLFIDNTATGKNKPAGTLIWNGSNWVQGSTIVTSTFSLNPGQSYIFRKNQSSTPSSVLWADVQSYLQ